MTWLVEVDGAALLAFDRREHADAYAATARKAAPKATIKVVPRRQPQPAFKLRDRGQR